MRQTKLIGLFSILVLLLAFSAITSGQKATVIKVSTKITTSTYTKRESTVCLSLISIGGVGPTPCRRRRQFWMEDPIVLDPHNQIDHHYPQFFIQPTQTYPLETTAPPMMGFRNDSFSGIKDEYDLPTTLLSSHSPQPSLWMPATDFKPRIYYLSGGQLSRGGYRQGNRRPNKKTTVIFTRTRTSTETEVSTKTDTVGIGGCTPSPLNYDICP